MSKIVLWQDEDYMYKFLTERDVGGDFAGFKNIVELDSETLDRWKRIQREYDQMQDEMVSCVRRSR